MFVFDKCVRLFASFSINARQIEPKKINSNFSVDLYR